jgi:hypothetical protein
VGGGGHRLYVERSTNERDQETDGDKQGVDNKNPMREIKRQTEKKE